MPRAEFTKEELYRYLPIYPRSFIQVDPEPHPDRTGWKISIQGKTLDDVKFLCERLFDFLQAENCIFKVISQRGIDMPIRDDTEFSREQCRKVMTIYCVKGMDFQWLCNEVYKRTKDYKGWYDIKTPSSYEHFAGGLFIRNDFDQYGNYVRALPEA